LVQAGSVKAGVDGKQVTPMNEERWLSGDALGQLYHAYGIGTDRQLRLFRCGWWRRMPGRSSDPRLLTAVEVAERFADGLVTEMECEYARIRVDLMSRTSSEEIESAGAANECLEPAQNHIYYTGADDPPERDAIKQRLLRDIFGNPFRPVAFDPAWRTATATSLAEAIYADRAFDRLPILADALEDAGCTSADVLEHCRQPGEHVRGCWVVDLVLAKS